MNIAQLLLNSARSFPDRPAVSLGAGTVLDYRRLGERSARLAASLADESPGVVAIALPNCVEYLEILFATWHGGLAVAPLNARLTPTEIAYMVADCGARTVFVTDEMAHPLSLLLPSVRLVVPGSVEYGRMVGADALSIAHRPAGDLAWIFYTSGTTGKPKGALLSHGNLLAMTNAYFADIDHLGAGDALLHLAATSHASGLFGLSHIAKASNNVLPESGGFAADELAGLINIYDNLTFFVPPTLLRRMGQYPSIAEARLDHVKTVLLGAAPVTSADIRAGHALFGPRLWNGYGQGESPCTISAMSKSLLGEAVARDDEDRLSSVGIVRTGLALRIVDNEGRPLPPGETGEVVVQGDTVMSGYLNRPEATEETLRDGWLYTGDLGRLDDEGFLTLLDRKKDLIISGGMNIYAREIEDLLVQCPGVLEAAVIGLPDPEWGESVMAVIVQKPNETVDPQILDAFCLEHAARFKRPKRYEIVADLPKNSGGKVLKRDLRDAYSRATTIP